jgi:hypothetical protein
MIDTWDTLYIRIRIQAIASGPFIRIRRNVSSVGKTIDGRILDTLFLTGRLRLKYCGNSPFSHTNWSITKKFLIETLLESTNSSTKNLGQVEYDM